MNTLHSLRGAALLLFGAFLAAPLLAQDFAQPVESFSRKKTSYVTLADGTTLEGTVERLKRKKGLIKEVKIEIDGAERVLDPAEIKHMYLPPSAIAELGNALNKMGDATRWDEDLDANILKEGYVYFETVPVMIKKDERTLLMQLLNPATARGVRVYHDPFAGETMSAGVAGVKVAGGDAKSYYVRKGDDTAYRLFKKDYKKEYEGLFGGCDPVMNHDMAERWSKFQDHVNAYADCAM